MRLPVVDVHTIGAGGGSIAWLDQMKMLHVGPQSAGADPGPACYGRGGEEPTSTDADLVLGYLNPDFFLGGEMTVDRSLAERSLKTKIADPLGLDVVGAARAVRKIIDHSMSDAISEVSVQRGEDPRRYVLVAAGGAGPVHVAALARLLGVKSIMIPRDSSIFCAIGSIIADLRHDLVKSVVVKTASADAGALNAAFDDLRTLGDGYLGREGISPDDRYYRRSIDMRYKGQFHEVELPVADGDLTAQTIDRIVEDFHRRHEELYAYRDNTETEMINVRVAACGRVAPPVRNVVGNGAGRDASRYVKGRRNVYFEEASDFVSTSIYDGDHMTAGNIVHGPAVIEESTTTIVVPPGARLEVTDYGDYMMTLQ
ncbi:MAG: hydantoinase/oxoprolinase family protein [Thermoleophilia bacterium]|nr:hydantoinase/oxoprolinase family protein [Thermoleophilia bacterium]